MPFIIAAGDPIPPFKPSGMNKDTNPQKLGAWADVTGWVADAGGYPGSTVLDNRKLVAQGTKSNATITARLPFSGGNGQNVSAQAQVLHNGVVVGSSPVVPALSGVLNATATVSIVPGDVVTVQATGTANFPAWIPSIDAGAGTYVQIT